MIDTQITEAAGRFLADDYSAACFAEWVGQRLGVELNPRSYKGSDFDNSELAARREAESQAGSQIREAMEENIPADAESSEYNWLALATWFNARYGTSLKDKDLRAAARTEDSALDRMQLEDFLTAKAEASIAAVDLAPACEFLGEDWGRRTLAGWGHHKFGVMIDPATWAGKPRAEMVRQLQLQARELYDRKEAEFPVRIGLTRYLAERSQGQQSPRYDRDGLAAWATDRFGVYIDPEEIRSKFKPEIEEMLIGIAHRQYRGGALAAELDERLSRAFPTFAAIKEPVADPLATEELAVWARQELAAEVTGEGLMAVGRDAARRRLVDAFDERFRPEMREMEKVLLLQILDQSWMEHLPDDGSPPEFGRPPRLRPGRPQGRVQAGRDEDLRGDVVGGL